LAAAANKSGTAANDAAMAVAHAAKRLGFRLAPLLPLPPAGNKAFELQEQMWSCLGQQLVQLSTIGF